MIKRNFILKIIYFFSIKFNNFYTNFSYNFYENGEYKLMQKLQSFKIKIIFDVGCNEGNWSKMVCKIKPSSKIYAFDINKNCIENLKNKFNSIEFFNLGLSNLNSNKSFNFYSKTSSLNSAFNFHNLDYYKKKIKVIRGDDFCRKKKIDGIDFLKIDVEGMENLVLEGFKKKLAGNKIKMIQFEYGYTNSISKFLMYDFFIFFKKYNYLLGRITNLGVDFIYNFDFKYNNFNSGPNFLAIHKKEKEIIKILKKF
jgi:FkbM family methyltransferase